MAARCLLLLALATGIAAQLLMPWTTVVGDAAIGPDGPWQAVLIELNGTEAQKLPVWPGGSSISEIPTKEIGGLYSIPESAVKTGSHRGASDSWFSTLFTEASWWGSEYRDSMKLEPRLGNTSEIKVNASFVAATEWTNNASTNKTSYKPAVGTLGLGPRRKEQNVAEVPSILEQLKTSGEIDRNAFSVHMGSAALNIPGSLVLGGYEQNRVLGQVGAFKLMDNIPMMLLSDIIMDVETGTSTSYPERSNGSFWQESTKMGQQITQNIGGPPGSVVVIPNPASPYIYLPPGFCEAIARNLKMTPHRDTGLYLWPSDPQAEIFVNSSAYLGFVLSDQSATNLTIKVPFKLLNLTLEAPLVEQPVNYFPCKSIDSEYGFWQLGRAFLQAAFLAVDYDGDVTYMAQAPGPDMGQSVLKKFENSTTTASVDTSFATTWNSSWQSVSMNRSSNAGNKNLSAGGIAGIAVAAATGILAGF